MALLQRWINVTGVDSTSHNVVCRWGCPQGLFSGVQIQLKFSLAQSEMQLALTHSPHIDVAQVNPALSL